MNNKSSQGAGKQKQLIPLPQQVTQFFTMRIEIEEQYARSLMKLNNRLDHIQNNPTMCGNVLMCLKSIHSQRVHQIGQFIQQLKMEKQNFNEAVKKCHKDVQKSINQAQSSQRNLKNIVQKVSKLQLKGQSQIRQQDEKFILKQLGHLGNGYNKKNPKESLKFLEQQTIIEAKLKQEYESLKQQGQKMIKKVKKHQKVIHQNSPQIQFQIIEFIKKYTIQEISLIRNLQYDIDNMIKKTKIFEEKEPQPQVTTTTKAPTNPTVKMAKQLFKKQFRILDPYSEVKTVMANQMVIEKVNQERIENIDMMKKNWKNDEELDKIVAKIVSGQKGQVETGIKFVQSFRHQSVNKFNKDEFQKMSKIFKALMRANFDLRNLQNIHQLIIYGSIYLCSETKQCLMDRIRKEQYLSDIYFWKFLIFFAIQGAVSDCLSIENQRNIHIQNNVFSALVSNSLNMIGAGIDKYQVRNTIAKMSKAFGLGERQLSDLLKFIDNGYQKYDRFKK